MKIVEALHSGRRISNQAWRVEIGESTYFAQAVRQVGQPNREVRLAQTPGVAWWRHFVVLSPRQRRQMELDDGDWLVALRRWIPGQTLEQLTDRARRNWQQWGADLAYIFQGIHAQKQVHGHLDPTDVIIGEAGRPTVVGLSPTTRDNGRAEPGESPFVAPELREEPGASSRAADVYALAALICWMATGGDVTTGRREDHPMIAKDAPPVVLVPDEIGGATAGIVERALMPTPEARPSVDELYEAFDRSGAVRARRFVGLPPGLYRGLERRVLEAIGQGENTIVLEGNHGTGRTFTMRRLKAKLEATGAGVIHASPDLMEGPHPERRLEVALERGPWEPLRSLVDVLKGGADVDDVDGSVDDSGDLMRHVRRWLHRLEAVLDGGPLVVLWDDFDMTAPDVRWFWRYALEKMDDASTLKLVVATEPGDDWMASATRFEVAGPDRHSWNGWRQRTLNSQVRKIPQARWDKIVMRCGKRPVELFDAINEQLDARRIPEFAERRPSTQAIPEATALFAADWRRHLDELLRRGACVQAALTCEQLYQVLTRSHPSERLQVLGFWMRAAGGTGHQPEIIEALEEALDETAQLEESRNEALLMWGRLYARLHRWDEALEILDDVDGLDGVRDVERLRWRADTLADAGRWEQACREADRGLELEEGLDESLDLIRLHLQAVKMAGRAVEGDREAIGRLRRIAGRLDERQAPPRLRAFCHRGRAVGLREVGEPAESVEAYLRALEVMESAGLAARLPQYLEEVGRAQRHRGRPGMAREYLQRGIDLVHAGTPVDIRRRLAMGLARLELVFGRIDRAEWIVEDAAEDFDEIGEPDAAARWFALLGDIERARQELQRAEQWYDRALDMVEPDSRPGVEILIEQADLAHRLGDRQQARQRMQRASTIAESCGWQEFDDLLSIVRARLQFGGGDLERMSAIERLGHHLDRAVARRRVELVLQWAPRLWESLGEQTDRDARQMVATAYHTAKDEALAGLAVPQRRQIVESLAPLPTPEELKQQRQKPAEAGESRLAEQNERLRRQIRERDDRIDELERRVEQLQRQLAEQQGNSGSGDNDETERRGRRPKASRNEVVEAMEAAEGDVEAAADRLGVSERTLYRYLNRYRIER